MLFRLANCIIDRAMRRAPDVVIGGADDPYLLRWHLIPRNPIFNVYLHQFLRDDDDRALHDHPWVNVSLLLHGCYDEHTIAAGGVHHVRRREAGAIVLRGPRRAHRIALAKVREVSVVDGKRTWRDVPVPCWTLFVTGPRLREWYFHCPHAGMVHWRDFTDPETNGRTTGKGCAQ